MSEYLERLYRVFPWVEDPFTAEGLERYRRALSELEAAVKHEWFRELLGRRRELRVVDLCSGTGIGGVALAKLLVDLGAAVSLALVDLRRDALAKAAEFCSRELGFKPETIVRDVLEGVELGSRCDVALLWGLTTPHFSPWDWVRVLSGASRLLGGDGIFLYEEADRVHGIFFKGYKDVLPERVGKDRVVLSVHKGRDLRSGYITRVALDLTAGETEEMRVYLWDIASSAAFTWIFFGNVDFVPTAPYRGIVMARSPRRAVNLEAAFGERPLILLAASGQQ